MKQKNWKKTLVLSTLFAVLATVKPVAQTIPNAYVYLLGNDKSWAYFIKDSVRFNLPGEQSFACSMTVEDGHVYIAGEYKVNGLSHACYWRDGVLQLDERDIKNGIEVNFKGINGRIARK